MATASRTAKPRRSPRDPLRLVFLRSQPICVLTVRPWIAVPALFTLVALGAWYMFATVYLITRDDLLSERNAAHAAERRSIAAPYEERIDELKFEVERLTARNHITQSTLEAQIEDLLTKQARLENRHLRVAELAGEMPAPPLPRPMPASLRSPTGAVRAAVATPADRLSLGFAESGRHIAANNPLADLPAIDAALSERNDELDRIEHSLSRIEAQQGRALHRLEEKARERAEAIRDTLGDLGVHVPGLGASEQGMGGLYRPLEDEEAFLEGVNRAEEAMGRLELLKSEARKLPLASPIPGAATTSNFGRRKDPFLGRMALHAGIDYRSPTGTLVRAAGEGRVVSAGYRGGYGKMVELAHEGGVRTRHAHLSSILVKKGQLVAAGEAIGKVGSTGRSTGPHLHYETRLNGSPLNPVRFIEAGRRLSGILEAD